MGKCVLLAKKSGMVDETSIIMEAVGKIRQILQPLKNYQQQTALAVAKELESPARGLQITADLDRRLAAFEASRLAPLAGGTQPL